MSHHFPSKKIVKTYQSPYDFSQNIFYDSKRKGQNQMTFMCKPISEIKKYIGDDLKVYRRFEDITAIPNELALTDDSPLPILVLNDDFFDDDFKE